MALGNLGKVLAGQAIETTKKNVLDALRVPETVKTAEKIRPTGPPRRPVEKISEP